jgi:serine/threonine protein kinase
MLLQVEALLGEGAFGKVYLGSWRGTQVAVKTIVLPANMSGAAKHERMVIMEAAISSSMNHPNVVQTYTYSIKPIFDATEVRNPHFQHPHPPQLHTKRIQQQSHI